MAVVWKLNIFSADAEKCYNEILSIGKTATAQQILDYARNPNSELHKCFEWDDTVAAEKYRLQQARNVVCHLVHVDEKKEEPQKIRLIQKVTEGYMPVQMIVRNPLEYEKLLERARAELRAFKQRYHTLVELEEILALID
jgi:anion-transporting  ArsA/GET3 family ATPase